MAKAIHSKYIVRIANVFTKLPINNITQFKIDLKHTKIKKNWNINACAKNFK